MAEPVLVSSENGVSKFRADAVIDTAFGKTVNKPYSYEFETYSTKAAAVAANKWPSDADSFVLAKINKQNEATAKSAAYQASLKTEKAEYEESAEYKFKQLVASIAASHPKWSAEKVEAMAKSISESE